MYVTHCCSRFSAFPRPQLLNYQTNRPLARREVAADLKYRKAAQIKISQVVEEKPLLGLTCSTVGDRTVCIVNVQCCGAVIMCALHAWIMQRYTSVGMCAPLAQHT